MWLNNSRDSSPSSTGRIATMRLEYKREFIAGAASWLAKWKSEMFGFKMPS
jgi:hypothetical protein